MKRITSLIVLSSLFHICFAQDLPVTYVNPFIGTGGHGHTFPGATLPHGMVQLSPDTRLDGWDGCGGYHYSDHFIYGFTHTHLSGTGVSDYGDILLMPFNGTPSPKNTIYGSEFDHKSEVASPGYYRVLLKDDNILAELTCTERTGMHHYTYSKNSPQSVILDLKHRDEVLESNLKIEDSFTLSGLRRSKAWAVNQYVFFVLRFSKPIVNSGIWINEKDSANNLNQFSSKDLKAWFSFKPENDNELFVKVGISSVSVEGARKNLEAELSSWDFDLVKKNAAGKWNKELSKIQIEDTNVRNKKIFYTALYHTAIAPNINMDVDSQYRGRDNAIHTAAGFTNYSVFSLWDTYRGANPLFTIIDRERTLDYIKTFLVQFQQGGRLPVWELASNETDCMIGYHSVPVITDAYLKGIKGFDTDVALEAMKKSANWDHLGLPEYIGNGMIQTDDESESVSKTLEYAYDDWCIAQFAKSLGKQDDYRLYNERAQYYKNLLDTKSGFIRPKKNGDWLSPFDPREVNNNYTEANSWQYSFYFPQDIAGYMQLTGGTAALGKKLDALFSESVQTTGRDQSDITGLIGQYAHGNEPSHHIIYLYNHAGLPYKTQAMIHKVMSEMYHDDPDGLIGNEDCGQMSAWYVLSALGFYPVTPGTSHYEIGTPLFKSAKINLENGNAFTIDRDAVHLNEYFIASAQLNSKSYISSYLDYGTIMQGGNIHFRMSNKPGTFGNNTAGQTFIADKIVINPVIHGGISAFKNTKFVTITAEPGTQILYTKNGDDPAVSGIKYTRPLMVDTTMEIRAVAEDGNGKKSHTTIANYRKILHDWSVKLNSMYSAQYNAGGADGLIDGIYGSVNWRKGNWQGYQKKDLDLVIDLKKEQPLSGINIGFLQDTQAWIIMPREVIIETSSNGSRYTEIYHGSAYLPVTDYTVQVKKVMASFAPINTRFIHIKALQFGQLPAWHEGAGGDSHIFIDEIEIK